MKIKVLKSKLPRVSDTETDLNYISRVAINPLLIEASNMIESEKVQIVNVNNGERLETHIITGERNSRSICLNGPVAIRVAVGEMEIIISDAILDCEEAKIFRPLIVFPKTVANALQ
jgi:aspartate 1-decarboxylase